MAHPHERREGFALRVVLGLLLVVLLAGCGQANSPAPQATVVVAPSAVTTSTAGTATSPPALVATPAHAANPTPVVSPIATPRLVTDNIRYSGALSVEDLNTLLLAIRALPGVQDVQGSVADLWVTYEPDKVTHQQIVEVIKSHNYTVKE